MAAPKFSPVDPLEDARGYESPPHVPLEWRADRPAELHGRQPSGPRLGYQGPDQGYGLLLASRLRPEVIVSAEESLDDAVSGCTAIALRRASTFGRAPVIHDLRIAFTICGFFDAGPPHDLLAWRVPTFEGVADPNHYDDRRAIADGVPEATLRMTPDQVASAYPGEWRRLVGA